MKKYLAPEMQEYRFTSESILELSGTPHETEPIPRNKKTALYKVDVFGQQGNNKE